MSDKDKKDEREGKISDTLRKMISLGVGAAFLTEDAESRSD